ncbi:MAG: LLM class flavin-dependent oxidoreductase [Micromonosporaceae bacterium]
MTLPTPDPSGESHLPASFAEGARRIEDAGFHGAWVFDAVNRGFTLPDPLLALAAAAAATQHMELGTGVLQLGIRHPVEVAHRVMSAHLACGDRLTLGVGAGSTAADFHAFGRPYQDRFARFPDDLELIRRLLRGEPAGDVDLTPWPSTIGGPRILIGTWSGSGWIPRAARDFDGWIASGAKGGRLAEGIRRFRAAGGRRAVVTNIHVELDGPEEPLQQGGLFSLRCGPAEAQRRLKWLESLGFDDAIVRTADHRPSNLQLIRELLP